MEECATVQIIHDVEEGEISDSASSVEEISEEAFKSPTSQPPPPASSGAATAANPSVSLLNSNSVNEFNSNANLNNKQQPQQRVWTMRDLYSSYPMSRNYSSGLYNLAWASAVQNKTLDEVLVVEYQKAENNVGNFNLKRGGAAAEFSVTAPAAEGENPEDNGVGTVVSGAGKDEEEEKEEGELEEGEIDFDSDMVIEVNVDLSKAEEKEKEDQNESVLGQDQTFDLIRKKLQTVTTEEAEKSLDEVSSRIDNVLDSIEEMTEKDLLTAKDVIAPLAFHAIKTVNTVFYSMNYILEESNKETMLRLLAHASNLKCPLFSLEQLKEIEDMVSTLDSSFMSLGMKDASLDKNIIEAEGISNSDAALLSGVPKDIFESVKVPAEASDKSELRTFQENTKSINSKWKGFSLPLLDLHKDHDIDSLPSPTRGGGPSSFPSDKGIAVGNGLLKPEWPVPRVVLDRETVPLHPYETDAVKAVSSYQQKFGRSSFFMNDRLPSPTPSEEGDTGEGDVGEEVSSSSNMHMNPVSTPLVGLSNISSAPKMDITSGRGLIGALSNANYGSNPSLKPSSVKSRDPRLRLISQEQKVDSAGGMINSKKQKAIEDLASSGPALKRHKNEQTEMNIVQTVSGTGGWLEDRGIGGLGETNRSHESKRSVNDPRRRPEFAVTGVSSTSSIPNITSNSNVKLPGTSSIPTTSLQSLLQDIAVNPSMWMNILKMEQHKSVTPSQTMTQPIMLNSHAGPVPSTSVVASRPPALGEKVAVINPTTPHIPSVEELGKVRMKPRDPRRILHSSTAQRGGNMELNQTLNKTNTSNTPGTMGITNIQGLDDPLDNKNMASHSIALPDITRQFTKNLKNIADMFSVSQTTSPQPVVPKSTSPPPVLESGNVQNVPGQDGQVTSGSAQLQNDWNDVEHLFEGFDDQQKAAIHKERARRLEEQRKMFAKRKLCLVLDLDHTLLNSAKFAEVDVMHDEMLRKKEELDREKSHRHLFRFPHMSMWTKLRPGIWNFLEKASKLYELHLYTMGNKLYATEMAKLLDPKGELFAGRVISRGDDGDLLDGDERVPKIKDLEGVMGMESSVVIIDDSVRVWPHNKLNLIVVERYIYFPCSRRQFGLPGPSLLEIDHDERAEDGTLAASLAVIERIHQMFFEHQSLDEADVRNILASEQRKILGGCRILFSRVFPVGEVNPHLHPLWQTAEQFGAICTTSIDDKVTHVVANSLGTDKVNWALSTGRFVVHPGWVEASALLYRRANEQDFAIKP